MLNRLWVLTVLCVCAVLLLTNVKAQAVNHID